MAQAPGLSVVIPAYNEEACAADCVAEVASALAALGQPFEIIVVDDASTDCTLEALRNAKATTPELRALRLKRHGGQSAAMAAGFQHARGDVVVTLDADLQNDPADIPAMLEKLADCDVVCGIRQKREDRFLRRASSRIANGFRRWMTHDPTTDTGCTLRVYRKAFLDKLKLYDGMHRFLPTLLRLEGARIVEMPVGHRPRRKGQSKYNIRNRLFRSLRDLFAVRWMQARHLNTEIEEEQS